MLQKQGHPSKADLIEAIRSGKGRLGGHLANCRQCRIAYEILEWSGADHGRVVWEPPTDLLRKHKAVPQLVASRHPARAVRGLAVTDSWDDRPAVAVRQAPFGIERRVRFEAGEYALEFVASRRLGGWDFVARVYESERPSRQFVLKVGSRKLPAGAGNCFMWRSPRPPQSLILLSSDLRIDLGRLEW